MKKDLFWKLSLVIVGLVLIDQFAKGVVQSLSEQSFHGVSELPKAFAIFHDKTLSLLVDHSYSTWVLIFVSIAFLILGRKTYSHFARKSILRAISWTFIVAAIFSKLLDLAMFGYEIKIVNTSNGHFGLSDFYMLVAITLFSFITLLKLRSNSNATHTI